MKNARSVARWSVACALGAALTAQAPVLHVGGPVPDFADLPAAVAAAVPGSILVVHPGTYTGFTTGKPLRVVLEFGPGGGAVVPAPGAAYAIRITGLPLGAKFVLVGHATTVTPGPLGAVRLDANAGTVVVEGLSITANAAPAIDVQNAASVFVDHSFLIGAPALQAQAAAIVTNDTAFLGATTTANAAMVLDQVGFEGMLGGFVGYAAPAIRAFGSELDFAGNGTTPMHVNGLPVTPVSAIELTTSSLRWQPAHFAIGPELGAPAVATVASTIVVEPQTALLARGAAPGGTATLSLTCPTPVPGVVVMGGLGQPYGVFGLNGLYVDPFQPNAVILAGQVNPAGLNWQATVPPGNILYGYSFVVQAILLRPNGVLQRQAPAPIIVL